MYLIYLELEPIYLIMKPEGSHLVSVPISRFILGLKTDVDVFIKLSDQNFIFLIKAGDSFEKNQLERYKDHHIKDLYVKKEDYLKFLKKQISISDAILKNTTIDFDKKMAVFSKVAASVFDELENNGLSSTYFMMSKEIAGNVVDVVERHPDLNKLLASLTNISEDFSRHSIAVSVVSTLIAIEMGWNRRDTLEKISFASLLHDIGKKEIDPVILNKPIEMMSDSEIAEYASHSFRGMMLLQAIPGMPEDIINIVYEHHENDLKEGYPRNIWDAKIHPLARVVGVANAFCDLTVKSSLRPNALVVEEAVNQMLPMSVKPFSKEPYEALQRIIKKKAKVAA